MPVAAITVPLDGGKDFATFYVRFLTDETREYCQDCGYTDLESAVADLVARKLVDRFIDDQMEMHDQEADDKTPHIIEEEDGEFIVSPDAPQLEIWQTVP